MKAPRELWTVAARLGDIAREVVFVGGMIRELLITDAAAGPARPTKDVDCVVDTATWIEYQKLSERLRARAFTECTDEGAPLCRWVVEELRVDVMPIDPAILGFSNVWYPSGVEHAIVVDGPDGTIRIVDAVHFCATKIEAFLVRGEGDYFHHDMEDLIAVVDGRSELVAEIERAPTEVREFIARKIGEWLGDEKFVEALAGHLAGDAASQARKPMLLATLHRIAALGAPEVALVQPPTRPRRGGPVRHVAALPVAGTAPRSRSMVSLRSSNLDAATYDPVTHTLTIDFLNGRTYAYSDVPANVYSGLLGAASHGRYFHQWIRDRYRYRRLR